MVNYGIRDIYKFYKKNSVNPVDEKTFITAWREFATRITDQIVYEGKDFIMPFHLGPIGIRKQKIIVVLREDGTIDKRYLRPDWKATNELWNRDSEAKERKQLVFHLNKHFNGFNCKWFWDKGMCSIPNQSAYSLVMTRDNKRKLKSAIFDENRDVDYYEQRPRQWRETNKIN